MSVLRSATKSILNDIAAFFGKIQRRFAEFMFHAFIKKNISFDFKKTHGGQDIICQVRIFGWLVGEQGILKLKKAQP